MNSHHKLSNKQKQFCREYITDFNATQAAIRAKYSEKTANEQGARLLAKVSVKAFLSELISKHARSKGLEISGEKTIQELALIGYGRMRDYLEINEDRTVTLKTFDEMPEGADAAISGIEERSVSRTFGKGKDRFTEREVTLKYKRWDKVKALEILARHLGVDKHKLTTAAEAIPTAGTLAEQAAAIFKAATEGKITTEDAAALVTVLQGHARIIEVTEILERLAALENKGDKNEK